MGVDNLVTTSIWIEKRNLVTITCNSSQNSNGILNVDDNGNNLIEIVDSGDTPLSVLKTYTGNDGLLLYNPTNKNSVIVKQGEKIEIDVDFDNGTEYYIGAVLLKSSIVNGKTFTVELNGKKIFKLMIDGREITSYSVNGNDISIIGIDGLLVNNLSELVVYAFDSQNITTEQIVIEYYQYPLIWDTDKILSHEYFSDSRFLGEELELIEDSLSIKPNVESSVRSNSFKKSANTTITKITNTIDMNTITSNSYADLILFAGNDEFRLLLVDASNGRIVLVNNCRLPNGVALVYDKQWNKRQTTISCGNYIDIRTGSNSGYGEGFYGKEVYGNLILNSHKISGVK